MQLSADSCDIEVGVWGRTQYGSMLNYLLANCYVYPPLLLLTIWLVFDNIRLRCYLGTSWMVAEVNSGFYICIFMYSW